MKRPALLFLIILFFCSMSYAMDIGFGYTDDGPTSKIWWNDTFGSSLGLSWNYSRTSYSSANSAFTYTVTPLIWSFFRNSSGSLSLSAKFRNTISYSQNGGLPKYSANNYTLLFSIPEMEINVPYVEGLRLIGKIGFNFGWNYSSPGGTFGGYSFSLSGLSFSSLGIMYYFSAGKPQPPAETPPPAATPEIKSVTTTAK